MLSLGNQRAEAVGGGHAARRANTRAAALALWAGLVSAAGAQAQPTSAALPWDLRALAAAPKWIALERPKMEGLQALTFEGLPYRGQATRVFAWLGLPAVKAGEKVPALVLVHGGGGTAFEEWVRLWVSRGYAAIAMDTCGQVPVGLYGRWFRDAQGGPPGWGGFDQVDQPHHDQWTYHAVADVILAHSLIRSLPEVDPERTGVTGISWGGYLSCIVAGVDHRFRLAVPVYGCGFYRETVFENNLSQLGPEAAARWMDLWDPSVYLPEAKMPILWVNGSNDFAYTLGAMQRSYRLPVGPRTLCVRLRMPHGHGGAGENPEEIRVFADSLLKNGAPLARIVGSGREGTKAWVTYESSVPVVKVELNFTRDTGRWQDRHWEALPADGADGRCGAQLPEGTQAYYFNLYDDRGCVVSTEHESLEVAPFQSRVNQSPSAVLGPDNTPLPAAAPAPSDPDAAAPAATVTAPAVSAVDLRPAFTRWGLAPRRQGDRPTCSAFVVAGALEFAAAQKQAQGTRLSVEFLNWASNQACGDQEDGGFFSDLWKGFAAYGICPEHDMPYRPKLEPAQPPSPAAMASAKTWSNLGLQLHWIKAWDVETGLTEDQWLAIKQTLRQGWPVCGGFRWPKQEQWQEDVLQMCPTNAVRDGHSVLLVGYRDEPAQLGGGVFVFRNTSRDGRDGAMPYGYARTYMNDAVWVDY